MIWLNYTIDAASLGALYALMALGLAILFGIMGLVNFAHASLIMIGAYAMYLTAQATSFAMAIPAAVLVVILAAMAMERIAFRPIRLANPMTLLVTSFALSYLLENLSIMIFGARAKSLRLPEFLGESVSIGSVDIPKLSIVTVVLTLVLLAGVTFFLKRTPLGIRMLAASADFDMARMLGVRADRVIAVAFGISGLLAAAVSIVLVARGGSLGPDIGLAPVLIAFAAVIIGGMGSLAGAALGGFLLGFTTIMLQALLPDSLVPFRDAFLFGIVILFLVVRPQGLLPAPYTMERT